jgi:hypothetical protein
MRDPDLVQRAERAALALERAWDRWRTMHGFGPDPLPPVSSYVGYSLEEPWGQPRVVFGVDAAEAEVLAALLDGHDCVGPVHAEVTASSEWRRGAANGMGAAPWPLVDQLSIPAQAPQPGSEMLPAASEAEVDAGPAQPAVRPGIRPEVPEFQLEVHHMNARDDVEPATSTSPSPDVLEPGTGDGAAASAGAAASDSVSADNVPSGKGPAGGGKAGGRSADSGPADSGPADSGPAGSGPAGSGSTGSGSPGGGPSGGGSAGRRASGSGKAGRGQAGGGSSSRGPSGSGKASGDPANAVSSGSAKAGSVSSGGAKAGSVSSGSGPSGTGGPDPAAATEANRTSRPPQFSASQPKPPAASAPRTVASGHSGAADALASDPERGPQAAPASQGQPAALPEPGTLAFRPRPESLSTPQQGESAAPTTNSDDLSTSQAPGHRGPRYQGYPPQYQDGPDPNRAPQVYAAAPVADSDVSVPASQPERGKSRQLSRLGRSRRQGPGAHEAWGSVSDQSSADHAI